MSSKKSIKSVIEKLFKTTVNKDLNELILDDEIIIEISEEDKNYLEQFTNLEYLSLNGCRLQSLNNLPKINTLIELELMDNHIDGKELEKLLIYPHLKKLTLANNQIKLLDEIKVLNKLDKLQNLDLSDNPITSCQDYRKKIFENFPKLVFLDMEDKDGNNEPDEEDEEDEEVEEEGEDFNEKNFIEEDEDDEEEDEEGGDVDENNHKKPKK